MKNKKRCLFLAVALLWVTASSATAQGINDLAGKRILILGDSITASGAYISAFDYLLNKYHVDKNFEVIPMGLSSETVSGLSEKKHPFPRPCIHTRLDNVLAMTKPDVVFACYGMNDGIYHPQSPERMKAYQDGTRKLLAKCKKAGAKVVLLTPPPFDPTMKPDKLADADAPDFSYMRPYKNYDDVLRDYANWVNKDLKDDALLAVVDFHGPLSAYFQERRKADPAYRSGDSIHPKADGHYLMAKKMYEAFGGKLPADLNTKSIEQQHATVTSDPLYKLVDERRKTRSSGWMPFVGYTRGKTVKKDSMDDAKEKDSQLTKQINELRSK